MTRLAGLILLALPAITAQAGLLDTTVSVALSGTIGLPQAVKYALHYDIVGTQVAATATSVTYDFSGPITVSTVDPISASWSATPTPVGNMSKWRGTFTDLPGAAQPPLNTQTQLSSSFLAMNFNDGSVLRELIASPGSLVAQTNVPFEGRMLYELGPVPTDDTQRPAHYRVSGCMGVQGSGLLGAFAGKRGAFCVSGTFNFPALPNIISALSAMLTLSGESNFTLVMH